jgi:hypothetical protein
MTKNWKCFHICSTFPLKVILSSKGNGTIVSIRAHEGPVGAYMYNSILSLTLSLDGCGWLTPYPDRFAAWKEPVSVVLEAVWTGPDRCGKFRLHQNWIPGSLYADYAIPVYCTDTDIKCCSMLWDGRGKIRRGSSYLLSPSFCVRKTRMFYTVCVSGNKYMYSELSTKLQWYISRAVNSRHKNLDFPSPFAAVESGI